MDYISLIHQFIDPIVTDLDKLTITEEKGEKENDRGQRSGDCGSQDRP